MTNSAASAKSSLSLFLVTAVANAALPAPEHVGFPSLDRDAAGAPIAISALYFRPPQAAPDAKVPLIIAAPGGGGRFSASAGAGIGQWQGSADRRILCGAGRAAAISRRGGVLSRLCGIAARG